MYNNTFVMRFGWHSDGAASLIATRERVEHEFEGKRCPFNSLLSEEYITFVHGFIQEA
jgi:hypothetical protein